VTGALIMATFVLGTSPLFAALGYAFRRAGSALGGSLGKVAAAAVVVVGLVSINSGLVLSGSPVSFRRAPVAGPSTQAPPGSVEFSEKEAPPEEASAPVGQPDAPQVQILALDVKDTSYSPSSLKARAGVPTKLILTTNRTQGCTRAFVIPDLNLQKVLPESGKTEISLGKLGRGKLEFTCSMGMYSGEINAS